MSWLLHKNNISHNLIRTNSPKNSLRRSLADALWDYAEDTISAVDFKNRLIIRSGITEENAEMIFHAVSELLYDEVRDYFECALLAKTVCKNIDLPDKLAFIIYELVGPYRRIYFQCQYPSFQFYRTAMFGVIITDYIRPAGFHFKKIILILIGLGTNHFQYNFFNIFHLIFFYTSFFYLKILIGP